MVKLKDRRPISNHERLHLKIQKLEKELRFERRRFLNTKMTFEKMRIKAKQLQP